MTEAIGASGAILLALCGLPQAIKTVREGHAYDVSALFLAMWFVGECLLLAYIYLGSKDFLLLANYTANLFTVAIVIAYKVRPRKETDG